MSGNLYPAFCRLLSGAGCNLVRQARGSHEVWYSPISGRNFAVPKNTIVRHTAKKVLKDAGLPKHF